MTEEILQLAHREILLPHLKNIGMRLSEFSFANLYLFRKTHDYRIVRINDCFFISGKTNDQQSFGLPLCDHKPPDMLMMHEIVDRFGMIYPVSDGWMKYFSQTEFNITHSDDDSDYIYTIETMASYPGRHLSKKRNLLKQFHQFHKFERFPISEKKDEAFRVLDQWQSESTLDAASTDYESAKEAITLMSELALDGYLYMIDGEAGGYVLGEGLTPDTYVLHFAKALSRYKGVYQFLYNDLANTLCTKYSYINFEQDLGLQSLRQAKSSYKPDHMGMKYRVTLRK